MIPVVDQVIACIGIFSGIFGFLRGGAREITSLLGWISSVWLTCLFIPFLLPFFPKEWGRGWPFFLMAFFIFALILFFSLKFGEAITAIVRNSVLRQLDRLIGLLFGFARAFLLLSACYLAAAIFYSPLLQTPSMRESVCLPYLEKGAGWIYSALTPSVLKHKNTQKNNKTSIFF